MPKLLSYPAVLRRGENADFKLYFPPKLLLAFLQAASKRKVPSVAFHRKTPFCPTNDEHLQAGIALLILPRRLRGEQQEIDARIWS